MLKQLFLVSFIVSSYAAVTTKLQNNVITLNDENFEDLTQVATGATTGDWFVKFYAPWCGHCKAMETEWIYISQEFHRILNVAEVDCTVNTVTCQRFGVRGYPTLLYFSHGKMYTYDGPRDRPSMSEFLREGHKTQKHYVVPAAPGLISKLLSQVEATVNSMHWHSDPVVNALLIGFALSAVPLVPILACLVCYWSFFEPREEQVEEEQSGPENSEHQDSQEAETDTSAPPEDTDDVDVDETKKDK